MELRDRFLEAIDYTERRLFEPVWLSEVAERAGFSPPYFSRLFRVLTGEPFGSYVRRRRLTVAAARLIDVDRPVGIVELALICQYDSQEAFTRAFKRAFGVPPGRYRKQPPRTRASWRSRIDAEALEHLQEVDTLPEALIAETIPRQIYAVFTHTINSHSLHQELQPTVAWIWGTWLPASAYEYAPGPDFEAYPEGFEPVPGNSIDICIPVRLRS